MSGDDFEVAILLADITGSTPLYEKAGDDEALRLVSDCLDRLRRIVRDQDGTFLRSKGDDVLSTFPDPRCALGAAREMLSQQLAGPLAIHVGIHFGPVIHARGDIFGDAVNLTARLAALAKPGESLATRTFIEQLPETDARSFRVLDNITFKGKSAPVEVYALLGGDAVKVTEVAFGHGTGHTRTRYQRAGAEVAVRLRYGGRSWSCSGGMGVSIGRSEDCDIVIAQPWVSRKHVTVKVHRGKVQVTDQSSSGTHVSMRDGYEFFMRRETVVLTGSGRISPAVRPSDAKAEVIHYEVVRQRPGQDSKI